MKARRLVRVAVVTTVLAVLAMMVQGTSFAASKATSRSASGRFLVVAKNSADYDALRAKALRGGANVVKDIPQIGTMLVKAPDSVRSSLAAGSPAVTVAVADTGLDFTHSELAPKVKQVVDFTGTEDPPICKTAFGMSDQDLANKFGGPVTTDWNGHGSWIGGNIAAALDGKGVNGIATKVNLVSLKISQWCGSAFDSELIDAFIAAADLGVDVVNISFGGYLNPNNPDEEVIYQAYVAAVTYARQHGTVIAAAAGNESRRIGAGGLVLSQGTLTAPGSPVDDQFGNFEVPGGIPGVVDVASTGNTVNAPSSTCPPGSTGTVDDVNATCKPITDRHIAPGIGHKNQLSYFSNYGPRIDVAAPGGARKFNLPLWDRGGTPGFPYTSADLTGVWEDFSTTSNFATQIDCFAFSAASGFPKNQCYAVIQGTSMAPPPTAAALALLASAHPAARQHVGVLVGLLKAKAVNPGRNFTQVLSATDTSPGDLNRVACPTGFCHLGGPAISNRDAYGAGLVDVSNP